MKNDVSINLYNIIMCAGIYKFIYIGSIILVLYVLSSNKNSLFQYMQNVLF
jgi:hypothetical protein